MSTAASAQKIAYLGLRARLLKRRDEIEEAVVSRVLPLADPAGLDTEYVHGLRAAIATATAYALEIVGLDDERVPPPPAALLEQARTAARAKVSLDAVLRRYFAGHAVVADFSLEEAGQVPELTTADLQRLHRAQAFALDHLTAAISAEHSAERERLHRSSDRQLAERIELLLAGKSRDTSKMRYDFAGHHVAAVGMGTDVPEIARELACRIDRRLLLLPREGNLFWAWLGGRDPLDPERVFAAVADLLPAEGLRFAMGEPAAGVSGWRRSHRQARAAWLIALRSPRPLIRYDDVALLATILDDDLLVAFLRERYLEPLEAERDNGQTLRETLRAYFATERNAVAAAATLGISRQTVTNRLRATERRLGLSLDTRLPELETALQIAQLESAA